MNAVAPAGADRPVVVGCALDGDSLACAIVEGGLVRTVTTASPDARPANAVIAWTARTGVMHTTSFPPVEPDLRRAALDALAAELTTSDLACLRVGTRLDDRSGHASCIGTAHPDEVADAWATIGDRKSRLVLAPLVLSVDGIWLGLHRVAAELTVVEHGMPKLDRQLACGGLESLGGPGDVRVERLLGGSGYEEPDVVERCDAYASRIADQVRTTLDAWRRGERIDTPAVYVHGRGAALPTIEARLRDVGLQALGPPSLPQARDIDDATRTRFFVAIQAALASADDYVGFRDVPGDERRAAVQRAATRVRRLTIGAAVAAAAVLGVGVPLAQGGVARARADSAHTSATHRLQALAPEEATYDLVQQARQAWAADGAEPDWSEVLAAILRSAPPTTSIVSLTLDDTTNPGSVTVTLEADGGPAAFTDLETWAGQLAANAAVSEVFAPSAASDASPGRPPSKTTFQLGFTMSARGVTPPRPFPS